MDDTPIRVMWTFVGRSGGEVGDEWLQDTLDAFNRRNHPALSQEGVSAAVPLYPSDVVSGLHDRYGSHVRDQEEGEPSQAEECLDELRRSATIVIDRREALDSVLAALRELEGTSEGAVEPGSVEAITDVSVAASGPPSAEASEPKLTQPYLDDRSRGGICLDRSQPSLRGSEVMLAVVEMGWQGHPDLPDSIAELLPSTAGLSPAMQESRHGNQVLGILCAQRDAAGIDGVVDKSPCVYVARFGDDGTAQSPADTHVFTAVSKAVSSLDPGSVVVAAVDARSPCYPNRLPLEAWQQARCLFHVAAELPVYVVTAAGNGLGVPIDYFCTGKDAPSPALVVGAAEPDGYEVEWMSNVGYRVDLHSWGSMVTTCDAEGYTHDFGGTSSATAIVGAAAAAVISHVKEMQSGDDACELPTPDELKRLLVATGYGWIPFLGPRPDVAAAVELLEEICCRYGELPAPSFHC